MIMSLLRKIKMGFGFIGIDLYKMIFTLRGIPSFIIDYINLKKNIDSTSFPLKFYPVLDDKYKQGGTAKGHYFHQDLLIAQRIYEAKPLRHIDIGSRVDGFIAHLAVFRKVEIIDIREMQSGIENISFLQENMIEMKESLFESCDSLSCLHALEHFGLGRYGDPIDFNGHLKGFENMYNILKPNGIFYFSVPIGRQRIEFNAHRVFSVEYLLSMFKNHFEIIDFSYVDDKGDLHRNISITEDFIKKSERFDYSCGIFELKKVSND